MAILRRPMFRSGGKVDSKGTGITYGLDTPKRGLVDGPGGYAGDISQEVKDYRKVLEEVRGAMPEQKGLSLADYLRIAGAGAEILGAPSQGGGVKGTLATVGGPLAKLGTDLAGSMERRGLTREGEISDVAQAILKSRATSGEGVFDRKLKSLSALLTDKQQLMAEIQKTDSKDPKYKSILNRLEIVNANIDLIAKADPILEGLSKNTRYQEWAISSVEAETKISADSPKFPWYKVKEKMQSGGFELGQGKAEGGVIGYENGGLTGLVPQPNEMDMQETEQTGEQETPDLSYAELRARLPKEITDEVVLLLSRSQQALIDFSNISTQKDVDEFNVKYGVQLILPSV